MASGEGGLVDPVSCGMLAECNRYITGMRAVKCIWRRMVRGGGGGMMRGEESSETWNEGETERESRKEKKLGR